jgi:hypothetical protein
MAELVASVLEGKAERLEADVRSERCVPADFWLDSRYHHHDFHRLLVAPEPRAILDVLENPPMSRADYWFAADFEEWGAWPLGRPDTRVLILFEVLVGLGHAGLVAETLEARSPRLAVAAALSGHPLLVSAAELALAAPGLGEALDRLRKKRPNVDDLVAVADFGRNHPRFLDALVDAIGVYSLVYHRGDRLLNPVELFAGFDRANPGKLVAFFVHDLERFPDLARRARIWARGERLNLGRLDATLYTECYFYRAAVLGAALAARTDERRRADLAQLLSRLDDEVQYFQSGSADGFCNDTRRMAATVLDPPRRRRASKDL